MIIDEMLLDERVRDHWMAQLAPLDPLLVGGHCSLHELERRELRRSNRPGLARWSARQAHQGMRYDVTVDTTSTGSEECAQAIATMVSAQQ